MKEEDTDVTLFDFFDELGKRYWNLYRRCLEPLVHIEDRDDELTVIADLPGVRKEEIEVNSTENIIEIKAKLRRAFKFSRLGTIHKEINFEYFHKVIKLPSAVIPEKSKAIFKRGMLEIKIPKKYEKKRIVVE